MMDEYPYKGEEMTPLKKEDETVTSLIVPKKLWEEAKIRAMKERISLGELIRKAIKDYLGKKPKKERG